MGIGDRIQELRELGLQGTAFRVGWELARCSGFRDWSEGNRSGQLVCGTEAWAVRLPFSDPKDVAAAVRPRLPAASLEALKRRAMQSLGGTVRCFGRWEARFGRPVDWYRDPVTGFQRDRNLRWTRALGEGNGVSEVKVVWEVARFPHAWELARAGAFFPEEASAFAQGLSGQIREFREAAPWSKGVHWASSQEVVFRLLSWLFAYGTLLGRYQESKVAAADLGAALLETVEHVRANVAYARHAVYNNHLLSEAFGLFAGGILVAEGGRDLREQGRSLLDEGIARQFYEDGGYIQLSHNYHRLALQVMLLALSFARAGGEQAPAPWRAAIERSMDFLVAHQNPADGCLPNYGANDGALPGVLSTCDFADFRPTLQAASLATRGERLYEPGPWDEESAWLLGPKALEAKLAPPARRSVSFAKTGFHVLRSGSDEATFATFRCGTIRDRFSQIDMLHVDLFWEGLNVLVDGGSYLYNGPRKWHDHFMETASHNTVTVDGRDQMKHFRKFKCLYWTEAELLGLRREGAVAFAAGEHYGYRRQPGACVHRRSLALHDGGMGVVADTVTGTGRHRVRLHWLFGEFPHEADAAAGMVTLATPKGPFRLAVFGPEGVPAEVSVAMGSDDPPRGWVARYFGEKALVASLAAEVERDLPARFLTVFGPGDLEVTRDSGRVVVRSEAGCLSVKVGEDGLLAPA